MKKIILLTITILGAAMLTGCGVLNVVPPEARSTKEGIVVEYMVVQSSAAAGVGPSRSSKAITSSWTALQFAAEHTLRTGYKYFAIHRPKLISNTDGSTMSTPEEFAAKCTNSDIGAIASAVDSFGFNTYACNMSPGGKPVAMIEFIKFEERPSNMMVYDATEMVSYVRAQGLYLNQDDFTVKEAGKSMKKMQKSWHKSYRDKM